MTRPHSITLFERLYLGGWAIGLLNTVVNWSAMQSDPRVVAANEQVGTWYLPTTTVLGLAIPLILWFFIARRGSVIAKWLMVVLTALGVVGIAMTLAMGTFGGGIRGIVGLVGIGLNVAAAAMLFRPDTRPWFGETPVEGPSA